MQSEAESGAVSEARETPPPPTDRYEKRAKRRGGRVVAGVDEAGRGPLAGPVVTAAVVFPRGYPDGLDDSKRLTALQRQALFELILAKGIVSIAVAGRERIDRMNILRASLWAMSRAIAGLSCRPDYVLVDGNMLPPDVGCTVEAIVGGDGLSVSIAAASIVAKVTRDRLMANVGRAYPNYGFERHMGYSTPEHFEALRQHGPCPQHRQSFAPVREQQLVLEI